MHMLDLSSSVRIAHIACYWKFFFLHYILVLCQYRLFAKQIIPVLCILCYNGNLVTWTVVSQSQSQSYIATDGQSISKSWCRGPSGAHDQIFITLWQLWSGFLGAPSCQRGRVCLLYMLRALASVVFLGSESFQSRDHILLCLIWDFPFRRLLRLAGSRWRYSNPPPHGSVVSLTIVLLITSRHGTHRKHLCFHCNCIVALIFVAAWTCLPIRCLETGCITPLFIRLLHSNGCTRYTILV
jgi:hypothetical protein